MAEGCRLADAIQPSALSRLACHHSLHAFQRPRRKAHLSVLHRHAKRDFRRAGVWRSFLTWLFTSSANLWNGGASSPTSRRASASDSYSSVSLSISRTGSRNDETCRMRSSGRLLRLLDRALLRERARPPFLARAQAAIPEIDERRVARLQRGEAEAIAGVRDVAAVELLDERFDAGRASPTAVSGSRPAKNMLCSASSCLRSASSRVRSRSMVAKGHRRLPRDEEPDERQPELARVRHRPIVDEDLGRRPTPPTI